VDKVTFSNVAPVIAVRDLDRALRRYRKLGFGTRAYEGPDRYGFVERDGVELHLSESPEHDRTRDGAEVYFSGSRRPGRPITQKALPLSRCP
jgi:hypothetical protein